MRTCACILDGGMYEYKHVIIVIIPMLFIVAILIVGIIIIIVDCYWSEKAMMAAGLH